MLTKPMDVLTQFPIRKTGKQKAAFRDAVQAYAEGLGYPVTVEKGSMGARNIVIGDPNSAKYLVTAHYDTPAGMIVPNFITPCNLLIYIAYQLVIVSVLLGLAFVACFLTAWLTDSYFLTLLVAYVAYFGPLLLMMFGPANKNNANDNTSGVVSVLEILRTMPENQHSKVCFVLFDLEEAGLVGSSSYRKAHKAASEKQIVLNMDCVGDGDEILLFPVNKAKKNAALMESLSRICGKFGQKSITLHRKGFAIYPSDQNHFPNGIGIAAFRRAKGIGLYCSRIHTKRDTTLEETNVNILRAALTTLISGDAAE